MIKTADSITSTRTDAAVTEDGEFSFMHALRNLVRPVAAAVPGSRIRLSHGYDVEPAWLNGRDAYLGTLLRVMPGQYDTPAIVVQLDAETTVGQVTGSIVVLEPRYRGQRWGPTGTVHVELCDFDPPPVRWQDRKQGLWVESHATYEVLP